MEELNDKLVYFGDSIKVVGNVVKGYLVRFGNPSDTDLEGDFFTSSTDFGRPLSQGKSFALNLYYHHGQDKQIGTKQIGTGIVKMDDKGLWYEAQINMNDEYNMMIAELAKKGKLGYSSGAAGHMVERKSHGSSYEIIRWNIAEGSLTPRPAESRNIATIKSLSDLIDIKEVAMNCPECGKLVTSDMCPDCNIYLKMCDMCGKMYSGDHCKMCKPKKDDGECEDVVMPDNPFYDIEKELISEGLEVLYERLDEAVLLYLEGENVDLMSIFDQFSSLGRDLISKLESKSTDMAAEMKYLVSKENHRPTDVRDAEKTLREVMCLSRSESKKLANILWNSLCDANESKEEVIETKTVEAEQDFVEENNNIKQTLLKKAMLDLIGD